MKALVFIFLIAIVGCGSSMFPPAFHGMTPVPDEKLRGDEPSFAEVFEAVLEPRCLRCHAEFADFETTRASKEKIRDEVATGRMPKRGPPLTAEEKEILFAWIDAGGIQFSRVNVDRRGDGTGPCPESHPKYPFCDDW